MQTGIRSLIASCCFISLKPSPLVSPFFKTCGLPTNLKHNPFKTLSLSLAPSATEFSFCSKPPSAENSNSTSDSSKQALWKSPEATPLEKLGYAKWLRAVAPKTYASDFEPFHHSFWDWWWKLTQKRAKGEPLTNQQLDCVLVMGRGLGKSASMEGALILAGALLGAVFCVYISSTQAKAVEHIQSIRDSIEGSELAKIYPGLSNPRVGAFGNQRGWKAEGVYTDSGFTVVAASLEKGIRGLRDAERRPLILVFDDIDERRDSAKVKKDKFETLRNDAMFMLAPFGSVLFGQNLIYNGSLMDDTWSRRADWFHNAHRIGIINTFKDDLQIEKVNGSPKIVAGTANWTRINELVAQDLLNKAGEDGIWRECQNKTAPAQEELVWRYYDPSIHLITWDDFERVFGVRKIPSRWYLYGGYDRGYTGWDSHPSVISVCAVADDRAPKGLVGDAFIFYEYVGEANESVGDLSRNLILDLATLCEHEDFARAAGRVRKSLDEDVSEKAALKLRLEAGGLVSPKFNVFAGSHEGKGERSTFAREWGLAVAAVKDSAKDAGLPQLHNYLQPEKRRHPFYPAINRRPNLYLLVAPSQKEVATDRFGLRRHRWEAENLKWDPNVSTRDVPTKFGDDATDASKNYLQSWALMPAPKTISEQIEEALPERLQAVNAPERPPDGWWAARQIEIAKAQQQFEQTQKGEHSSFWDELV
jgi:hypothetical protein